MEARTRIFAKYVNDAAPHLNTSQEELQRFGYRFHKMTIMSVNFKPKVNRRSKIPCILIKPEILMDGTEHLDNLYGLGEVNPFEIPTYHLFELYSLNIKTKCFLVCIQFIKTWKQKQ